MAMTRTERLHRVLGSPGLVYTVSTWLRADTIGTISTPVLDATDALIGLSTTPTGDSLFTIAAPGDILEVGNEDMLIIGKGAPPSVTVEREQFGTTFGAPGYPASAQGRAAAWIWKNITDRVGLGHGVEAVMSFRRSFEKSLNRHESSTGVLVARNEDQFWDKFDSVGAEFASPITGVSALRQRWVRFYLHARSGPIVETIALGTFLIGSVEPSGDKTCRISLKGLGSLLRGEAEASSVRMGRERYSYTPTFWLVQAILEQTDYRTSGTGWCAGIPLQTKRHLASKAMREIPVDRPTVSHYGKIGRFVFPSGTAASAEFDFFTEGLGGVGGTPSATGGGFPTAHDYDPQAGGVGNVVTGDPAVAGRHYFGVGPDIWELDENTGECAVAFQNATPGQRITHLFRNTLDSAAAGKPKLCGKASADYPVGMTNGGDYSDRGRAGTLFRWNGGSSFAASLAVTSLWPGTHFFRDGQAAGQHYLGGIAGTENVGLPFGQRVYGFDANGSGGITVSNAFEGHINSTVDVTQFVRNLDSVGIQIEPGRGTNGTVTYVGFNRILSTEPRLNLRFTYGNQGCCALVSTTAAWATGGAIVYCEVNATTGVIAIKAWRMTTGGITTLKTFASPTEQPCSMAGNGYSSPASSVFRILFVGLVTWSESSSTATTSGIIGFSSVPAESTVYASGTDTGSAYHTPLAIGYVADSTITNAAAYVVTWFRRDRVGDPQAFSITADQRAANITSVPTTYRMPSMLHAWTQNLDQQRVVHAMDTAGRLIRYQLTTAGLFSDAGISVPDGGRCPVDGESWSACHRLVVRGAAGSERVYGVSAPAWPSGPDTRDGKNPGQFIFWRLSSSMWDTVELGYFGDDTPEEALGHLAFGGLAAFGSDYDGRGNFIWDDRFKETAPVVTYEPWMIFEGRRRRGDDEIENPVEIAPWTLRGSTIEARVDLSPHSTLTNAREAVDVHSTGSTEQTIVLTCQTPGRVGVASFSVYVKGGTYKTQLVTTYPAGTPTSAVNVAFRGRSAAGPWDEDDVDDRARQVQIPRNSRVFLPDGQEGTVTSITEIVASGYIQLNLETAWTPSAHAFSGQPVDIELEVSRQTTLYVASAAEPAGIYSIVSDHQFQEVGAGMEWATGVMIRWREPNDTGADLNHNEGAWASGDRIVIQVSGVDVVENKNAKIRAFNADYKRKYGDRPMKTSRGRLTPRRTERVANARLNKYGAPPYVYEFMTFLSPHVKLFDVIRIRSKRMIPEKLNPEGPHTDHATVRGMEFDPRTGLSMIEAIAPIE